MSQSLALISLVVPDYDEAIAYYTDVLGFEVVEDREGGRVFLFLHTDNFDRDYDSYRAKGVEFIRPPADMTYGRVSVFRDRYGNLWDLVQPSG
ncbi:MAG TPA: VOC family protein [Gemmatimonadales bacterium]|nr:VOC family protein [Gemmatimonadales bacterium]